MSQPTEGASHTLRLFRPLPESSLPAGVYNSPAHISVNMDGSVITSLRCSVHFLIGFLFVMKLYEYTYIYIYTQDINS